MLLYSLVFVFSIEGGIRRGQNVSCNGRKCEVRSVSPTVIFTGNILHGSSRQPQPRAYRVAVLAETVELQLGLTRPPANSNNKFYRN